MLAHELTALLRSDPGFECLRQAIRGRGVDPGRVLLAGFFEDEVGHEFGAIVAPDGRVFAFKRSSVAGTRGFVEWNATTAYALTDVFAAIHEATAMTSGHG